MKLVVSSLAIVLIASSCVRPSGGALTTPSPTPSAEALASGSPASPSAVAGLGFSCRLPIYVVNVNNSPGPSQSEVGFLSLPDGKVTLEPAPASPRDSQGTFYYDRAFSRWLPVGRDLVSPDGSHYAYNEFPLQGGSVIHVVNVATGDDKAFVTNTGSPQNFGALFYASVGLYLDQGSEGPTRGLWLMDPNTGAIRQLADLRDYVEAITESSVWLGTANPADPYQGPIGLVRPADGIDRFDLATGTRAQWLYLQGMGLYILGVDVVGHPIVLTWQAASNDFEARLLTGPGQAQHMFNGTFPTGAGSLSRPALQLLTAIGDSRGIWFGGPTGIYVYSPRFGLLKVFGQTGLVEANPGNGCL